MKIFILLLFLYGLVVLFFYITQDRLLYHPKDEVNTGLKYIDKGRTIVINPGKNKAIIYFGGNSELVSNNVDRFTLLFPDRTVYLMNYRGYGNRLGYPSQKLNFKDAEEIYDLISKNHKNISVIGRSLGSGLAVHVAASKKVSKLILVTPYDSVLNVAKDKFFFLPVEKILRDKYDSLSKVKEIKTNKILFLIADKDTVIPYKNSFNLYNEFKKGKFSIIRGENHNSIPYNPQYEEELVNFIKQ